MEQDGMASGSEATGCGGQGAGHPAEMSRDLMMQPRIANHPHQHAMTLVGHKTVFAVHMTQFYMEEHKYQLIFEVGLPPEIAAKLDQHRRRHPKAWFVLSNDESDLFTIPQIASGRKKSYRAKIFQGLPDFSHKAEETRISIPGARTGSFRCCRTSQPRSAASSPTGRSCIISPCRTAPATCCGERETRRT